MTVKTTAGLGFNPSTQATVETFAARIKTTREATLTEAVSQRQLAERCVDKANEHYRAAQRAIFDMPLPSAERPTVEALDEIAAAVRNIPAFSSAAISGFTSAGQLMESSQRATETMDSLYGSAQRIGRLEEPAVGLIPGAELTGRLTNAANARLALDDDAQKITVLWDCLLLLNKHAAALDPNDSVSRAEVDAFVRQVLQSPVMRGGEATQETWAQKIVAFAETAEKVLNGEAHLSVLFKPGLFPEGTVSLDQPLHGVLRSISGALNQRIEEDKAAQLEAIRGYREQQPQTPGLDKALNELVGSIEKFGYVFNNAQMNAVAQACADAGLDPFAVPVLLRPIVRRVDPVSGEPYGFDLASVLPGKARREAAERFGEVLKGRGDFSSVAISAHSPVNEIGRALGELHAFMKADSAKAILELCRQPG